MGITEEHVRPVTNQFSRTQWIGTGLIMGIFLGFVDTLLIAALLGYLKVTVPAYVGVPTTCTGYFFSGLIIGKLAPPWVEWEPPVGIFICATLFMMGFAGFRGEGIGLLFLHYVLIPGIAMGISYVGLRSGRGDLQWPWKKAKINDEAKTRDIGTASR
jgi:hypothetical protein